jgi:hypothetical protein
VGIAGAGTPGFIHTEFVDARPPAQIAANQAPASFGTAADHPTDALQGPAHDTGGFRSMSPTSAAAVVPSVGVQGAGTESRLPQPGVKYGGSPNFSFPPGYGHASVKGPDGSTMFSFSSPEDQARTDSSAATYRKRQQDDERHAAIGHANGEFMAMLSGEYGKYGNLDPESRAYAMQTLGAHLNNLIGADTQQHVAAQQFGSDPHRNPAYVAALTGQLNANAAYANAHAQHAIAQANDLANPEKSLQQLRTIMGDATLRTGYLVSKGVDGQTIAALPPILGYGQRGQVDAASFGQHLAQPQNASMAQLLDDKNKDMDLGERLAHAAQFTGFEDPNSQPRQLFDQWLRNRYASDPSAWAKELYSPPNPDESIPYLGRIPGLLAAAAGPIFGEGATGTGLSWRSNYDQARRRIGLIQKYGIAPQ